MTWDRLTNCKGGRDLDTSLDCFYNGKNNTVRRAALYDVIERVKRTIEGYREVYLFDL